MMNKYRYLRIAPLSLRLCTKVESKCNLDENIKPSKVLHDIDKMDLNDVVKNAEKIVGYSTSFINLRWLLSDEVANVAQHLRKLVGIDHPILHTAKSIICNEQNNTQSWGLVILLLSKAAGHIGSAKPLSHQSNDTSNDQRVLAELTEIIKTGNMVHKGLLNIYPDEKPRDGTVFGNKIGLLIGDYLLVTANGMLAKLKNQQISELISAALRDLSEGEFVGDRDPQNFPLPSRPVNKPDNKYYENIDVWTDPQDGPINTADALGYATREWTVRSVLSGGSLLGRACESALALAQHPLTVQKQGYYFGCYVALAFRASDELTSLKNSLETKCPLVSAPVLFALEHDSELYDKIITQAKDGIRSVNFNTCIRDSINSGPAMKKTKELCVQYTENSIKILSSILPNNDASRTLKNLISAATAC